MNTEEAQIQTVFRQGSYRSRWMIVISLGLIVIFYLGWVYQASWYWYYGLSPTQLNLSLPTIFQQGIELFMFCLSVLLLIFGIIFLLRLILLCLGNFFSRKRHTELSSLFSIFDIFQRNIHFVALVYVALIYLFLKGVKVYNSDTPKLEMPSNIAMLHAFTVPLAFILFIRLLGDFLFLLPEGFKQGLRLTSESKFNDEQYRVILDVLLIFAASIIFTGNMAVGDASVGFRQDASYQAVRRVYLKSYLSIAGLEPYRQDCDCSPYVYGPMGYLGNNQEYLFLVPWKLNSVEYFPQFPLLYQIERSSTNTINIIPDGASPPKESPPASGMSLKKIRMHSMTVNALQAETQEELDVLLPPVLDTAFKPH